MRALRFHGPGDLRLETVARPPVGPGIVVVDVEAAGVCGSDLHFLDGSAHPGRAPLTLGHEIAGTVAESDVAEWRNGDEVVVAAGTGCGRCPRCREGRTNLCQRAELPGIDYDGGWAESVAVPGKALLGRPAGLPAEVAATAPDAGATAYHAVMRRGAVRQGDAVVIVGAGGLGSFAVQFAKMAGAAPIIVVDISEEALERARTLGADEQILADGRSGGRAVRLLTDGGADVALEFVGAPEALDMAVKSLRPGGRAVAAGVGAKPLTTVPPVLWATMEYELRGAFGSIPGDTERVLEGLAAGSILPPPIEPVPLEDAPDAILAASGMGRMRRRLMLQP